MRALQDVTPRMRRVTLGGDRLGAIEVDGVQHPAFAAPGFDDHVKVIFASDGDVASALPVQLAHGIEWPASDTRLGRDYTPRRVAADEFDLDFVLHGDGPAATWAMSAAVGDELWFVGPKSSTRLPDEVGQVLLAGDETALPAIGRYLDERPVDTPVVVIVTVSDPSARQELRLRPEDTIEWVEADPTDAAALEDAVRRLWGSAEAEPAGYAWAAAESTVLLPVRRYLARELGMPKSHLNITGYWNREDATTTVPPVEARAGASEMPHGHGADDGARQTVAPVASPLPWFVVRAAIRLGVTDVLAATSGISATALAERVGVTAGRLGLLLPVLRTHGVVAGEDDALRLGAFGDELVDDEHVREEYDGFEADTLVSLELLAEALRSGRSTRQERSGATLAARAAADVSVYTELIDGAGHLVYLLDSFVADEVWTGVERCVLTGPGSAALAGALLDHGRVTAIGIAEQPAGLDALQRELGEHAAVTWTVEPDTRTAATVAQPPATSPAQLVVSALGLAHRTDAEAVSLLTAFHRHARTAVVIESSRPDGLGDEDAEAQLDHFAQTGSPMRDADAIGALAAAAGWRTTAVTPLGWGVEAITLTAASL